MKTSDTSYLYLWVHSALAATSITFFLALLSADPSTQNATEILLTSFFFTISLILNSLISIYFVWLRDAGDVLNSIFKQKKAFWVIKIGVSSFLFGLIFLLSYYSFWFVVVAILSGFIGHFTLGDYFIALSKNSEPDRSNGQE